MKPPNGSPAGVEIQLMSELIGGPGFPPGEEQPVAMVLIEAINQYAPALVFLHLDKHITGAFGKTKKRGAGLELELPPQVVEQYTRLPEEGAEPVRREVLILVHIPRAVYDELTSPILRPPEPRIIIPGA